MLSIMGEVASAAGAAAGLILVFFGSALSGFDTHTEGEKASVRVSYRWRAWPALVALIAALTSCGMALWAKGVSDTVTAQWAILWLAVAGLGILTAAIHAIMEIG